MAEPIRVLIVADSPIIRVGFQHILEDAAEFDVTLCPSDPAAVREAAASLGRCIALVDVVQRERRAAVIEAIKREGAGGKAIVFVGASDRMSASAAVRDGADVLLDRGTEESVILLATKLAYLGNSFIVSETLWSSLTSSVVGRPSVDPGALLTSREQEVLALLDSGRSDAAIARELFISVRTVKHHVSHILQKLSVSSRKEAVEAARSMGLLGNGAQPTAAPVALQAVSTS